MALVQPQSLLLLLLLRIWMLCCMLLSLLPSGSAAPLSSIRYQHSIYFGMLQEKTFLVAMWMPVGLHVRSAQRCLLGRQPARLMGQGTLQVA
jgi:hypothetical protein